MHSEVSPKPGKRMVQMQRPLKNRRKKFNEPQWVNTGLKKETGCKMFVGTYRLFAHPIGMITTVGKHLLGNEDRW